MRRFILIVFLLVAQITLAQVNLVPNPSFEEHDNCPNTGGNIWRAVPWHNLYGTCDYFHECGINGYNVPGNWGGWESARTGEGYGQFALWSIAFTNAREFVGVELTTQLDGGSKYNVEFYISMQDSMWYAVKNVGMHFSASELSQNIGTIMSKLPQIGYTGSDFITEKNGWIKISGSFIAEGGEKYLTIGNFEDDTKTDTLFVSGGGVYRPQQPIYWSAASYYIDDVSVTLDTTYIGIAEQTKIKYKLYPNPNDGNMYLEYVGLSGEGRFELFDIAGRRLNIYPLMSESGKLNITEQQLVAGIYTYRVVDKDMVLYIGKVVVQH